MARFGSFALKLGLPVGLGVSVNVSHVRSDHTSPSGFQVYMSDPCARANNGLGIALLQWCFSLQAEVDAFGLFAPIKSA